MKLFTIILGVALLAGCSGLRSSGASGMSSSDTDKPYSMRVFNPNDPYHGG